MVQHETNQLDQIYVWQLLPAAIESVASETVLLNDNSTQHQMQETVVARSSNNYFPAAGERIPKLGEQKLPEFQQEGSTRAMMFQACAVAKPLGSFRHRW